MKPENSLIILGRIGDHVYQRTKAGLGNVPSDPTRTLQYRRYVAHLPPGTPHQQQHRSVFRAAVFTWQMQSTATKKQYNSRAAKKGMSGFNLWISEYMRRYS